METETLLARDKTRARILALVLQDGMDPFEQRTCTALTDLYLDLKHASSTFWDLALRVVIAATRVEVAAGEDLANALGDLKPATP